jgi:hypothetical protein
VSELHVDARPHGPQVSEAEAVVDIQFQFTGAEAAAAQRRVKQAAVVRPRMAEHLTAKVPKLTSPGRALQRTSRKSGPSAAAASAASASSVTLMGQLKHTLGGKGTSKSKRKSKGVTAVAEKRVESDREMEARVPAVGEQGEPRAGPAEMNDAAEQMHVDDKASVAAAGLHAVSSPENGRVQQQHRARQGTPRVVVKPSKQRDNNRGSHGEDAVADQADVDVATTPVRVRLEPGGPRNTVSFREPWEFGEGFGRLTLFEHVADCRVCEGLYDHFPLPNGKLAHIYDKGGQTADPVTLPADIPPPLPMLLYDALAVHRNLPPTDHFLRFVAPRDGDPPASWRPAPELPPPPPMHTLKVRNSLFTPPLGLALQFTQIRRLRVGKPANGEGSNRSFLP